MTFYGPADGVFAGGGVKVAALAGALQVAEKYVSEWRSLAGTSGGAIIAGLLAAGYDSEQIWGFLSGEGVIDSGKVILAPFKPKSLVRRRALWGVPVISPLVNLLSHLGAYNADALETSLAILLGHKQVFTFADVKNPDADQGPERPAYRLQLIATDLTHRRVLVLPQGLKEYMDPDTLPVAQAIRMSFAVPLLLEPVVLQTKPPTVIIDGGLVSNYPVWLFDAYHEARWPTFGFLLDEGQQRPRKIGGIWGLGGQMAGMLGSLNDLLAERTAGNRTVCIPMDGLGSMSMNVTLEQRRALRLRGHCAAEAFFEGFDPMSYRNSGGHPLADPEALQR